MIAIPDFAAGAMENWGLIVYRETVILYQPGVSSEGNKQRVAVVVSDELAHQVFYVLKCYIICCYTLYCLACMMKSCIVVFT